MSTDQTNPHAAGSAEPFHKPDHKAKKHGRPNRRARKSEVIGGGFFVFRRHESGRVAPNRLPFEHGTFESAAREAARLSRSGDTFAVFAELKLGAEGVVDDAGNDNWDYDPRSKVTA